MRKRRDIIIVDGKEYHSTRLMAEKWEVAKETISGYCREGLVPGAFKDSTNKWFLPGNAPKPPTKSEIRKVLFLSLQLKNAPACAIDYHILGIDPAQLPAVYDYLAALAYIRPPSHRIEPARLPYEVQLTQKGLDLVFQAPQPAPARAEILHLINSWGPTILNIIAGLAKSA